MTNPINNPARPENGLEEDWGAVSCEGVQVGDGLAVGGAGVELGVDVAADGTDVGVGVGSSTCVVTGWLTIAYQPSNVTLKPWLTMGSALLVSVRTTKRRCDACSGDRGPSCLHTISPCSPGRGVCIHQSPPRPLASIKVVCRGTTSVTTTPSNGLSLVLVMVIR